MKLKERILQSKKITSLALVALLGLIFGASSASAAPLDFSTMSGLDVSVTDVIGTGFSFANMFNEYTMLILGIILAPVLVGFIIWLWRKLPRFGVGRS